MNFDSPHRRYNPLNGQWVLVSPHRARRPWQGQVEKVAAETLLQYDPTCYLCPGNQRSTGQKNPPYTGTFAFDNDFPALLLPDGQAGSSQGIFQAESEYGICRVVCFSARHDLTLPEMDQLGVEQVVKTWTEQSQELCHQDFIRYVQVFENKGAVMGCSNPHPHSQIWATGHIPNEPAQEAVSLEAYQAEHGRCLLCETWQTEEADGQRIVASNPHFLAVVPFWAVWPFEVLLLSRRHLGKLTDLTPAEVSGLADIMRQVTIRYDNLFEVSFPYSMGFHQTPCDGGTYPGWHFHAHYYPPLLRSATVRKFMVGFEMLAMAQRDLTAETAAERLRSVSAVHYKAI
jgi:UDPglucose--hexose-1-phosphate uridylyltransferase